MKMYGGKTADMADRFGFWLLLASTDIMAADATADRIMNHDVSDIKRLRMGYEMGLGKIRNVFEKKEIPEGVYPALDAGRE